MRRQQNTTVMGQCGRMALALTIALTIAASAPAGTNVYPDGTYVNVKDYGAVGDGVHDDTAAIQQAIRDHAGIQFGTRTIYFPNGTYKVSDTIDWAQTPPTSGGQRYTVMQGETRNGVVIKLADNASGFGNAGSPKPVIDTRPDSGSSNVSFRTYVQNLTIDIGAQNAGATGLRYLTNNTGAVTDVTIRSSDPSGRGARGLDLSRRWQGPGLVRDLKIEGFDTGIYLRNAEYSTTFENVEFLNQRNVGLDNRDNIATFYNLTSTGGVPVIKNGNGNGLVTVVKGNLQGTNASKSAVINSGQVYLRDVQTAGFGSAVQGRTQGDSYVKEWTSTPVETMHDSPSAGLNLPVKPTPTYQNNNFEDWAVVSDYGAHLGGGNDTAGIQAAMNSGKPVVYFPSPDSDTPRGNGYYTISDTITIPPTVRKIIFSQQTINIAGNEFANSSDVSQFKIVGGDENTPPLIIDGETGRTEGNVYPNRHNIKLWEHDSPRDLVLQYTKVQNYTPTDQAGDVYMQDVVGSGLSFKPQQHVWIRQLNTEGLHETNTDPLVLNDGATLWVLNVKTEGARTVIKTINGGKTEVLGGLLYPVRDFPSSPEIPAFVVEDGSLSVNYAISAYSTSKRYSTQVRSTQDGSTERLLRTDVSGRGSRGSHVPLTTSYKTDKQVWQSYENGQMPSYSQRASVSSDLGSRGDKALALTPDAGTPAIAAWGFESLPHLHIAMDLLATDSDDALTLQLADGSKSLNVATLTGGTLASLVGAQPGEMANGIALNQWHTLHVFAHGDRILLALTGLDGQTILGQQDLGIVDELAGPVGGMAVVATGDGTTYLDDVTVQMAPEPVIPLLSGDANGDGQVDGNDLISVEENFGATGNPGLAGDANGDGQVDGNDLVSVEESFGSVDGSVTVPEPMSLGVWSAAGLALLRRRSPQAVA